MACRLVKRTVRKGKKPGRKPVNVKSYKRSRPTSDCKK